jgi:hypothetical protein
MQDAYDAYDAAERALELRDCPPRVCKGRERNQNEFFALLCVSTWLICALMDGVSGYGHKNVRRGR